MFHLHASQPTTQHPIGQELLAHKNRSSLPEKKLNRLQKQELLAHSNRSFLPTRKSSLPTQKQKLLAYKKSSLPSAGHPGNGRTQNPAASHAAANLEPGLA
jgi:hypothetical protein